MELSRFDRDYSCTFSSNIGEGIIFDLNHARWSLGENGNQKLQMFIYYDVNIVVSGSTLLYLSKLCTRGKPDC